MRIITSRLKRPSSTPRGLTGIDKSGETMELKTLNLVKGKNQFCFRYEPGQESNVVTQLVEMVNRRELAFDWFDAAVLAGQLGLAMELKSHIPRGTNPVLPEKL